MDGFNTDQPPFDYFDYNVHDPNIIGDALEEGDEDEEGDFGDIFNYNYIKDYGRIDHEVDEYDSVEEEEEERDLDQIMAPEIQDDATYNVNHQDDDSVWPSERTREDVVMTDHTDDGLLFEDDDNDEHESKMHHVQGALREWVARDDVRRFIANKFKNFFLNNPEQIHEMMSYNKCSLEIDYKQLLMTLPVIAIWLVEEPQSVLAVMEQVASKTVFNLYANYKIIQQNIFVSVTNLPLYDRIRDLRQMHLNKMIRVGGIVSQKSTVFPRLQQVKYNCNKCGSVLGPFVKNSFSEVRVGSCPKCQSEGPFNVNMHQKLTLQESPDIAPVARLPRQEVILSNELIDCACLGDEIEVTGIYTNNFDSSLNTKSGFPVFATVIEANHVTKKQDQYSADKLTREEKAEIVKLSKDTNIRERIIKSIAPSIYGHDDIKTAIALALFGGQEKNIHGTHVRGDIHVLLLGDPATAKSHFLKYVEKTGERAIYKTGKGASAAAHKDPVTREWTSVFVLADKGICLIDNFDKINNQDREYIHEAMTKQSINTSKAGIVTSVQARCSVIAAANPKGGERYNSSKSFSENVDLTDPIVSSFDLLCVVKDVVDPEIDEMLATFVVNSHFKSQPKDVKSMNNSQEDIQASAMMMDPEILSQNMLKKYISYAKSMVFPEWHDVDIDRLANVYADLRSQVQGVPIVLRHLESMIRMSEAHAKMHLRQHVTHEDVGMAIRVFLNSVVTTQRFGEQKALKKSLKKYITEDKDFTSLMMYLLKKLGDEVIQFEKGVSQLEEIGSGTGKDVRHIFFKVDDLQSKALDYGITNLKAFFMSAEFGRGNFQLDEEHGVIRKVLR